MPQIERNIAAVFLVFSGIYVNHFSLPLSIAILVAAILVQRGYQMSDLNVQNSSRVHTLASSLYTWTENAVLAIAEKCKLLTNSDNRAPAQHASSSLESDVHQDYYPDTENVFGRENIFKGNAQMKLRKVNYQLPDKTSPYSSVTPVGANKGSNFSFREKYSRSSLRASEKESLTPRDSPWGYSLSPQQRSPVADVKPVQSIAGPLLASAKYNTKRNPNLYVDVSSPGFSSRLLKYSEAATHQPQYARPGQLPLVHLNKSPMPTLSPHNSRKVQVPVRLRIAPSSYDVSESRLFSRNDHQQESEQQPKSVVEVLKEISRKRFRTEDVVSDPKRHHRSDSSSSSSSSSSPAFGNEMSCDQTPSGKRPREEDSPKLQKKNIKRTHNNEIFSSLSSSRNIRVGTKRKAADNLSRSTTPSPIGKLPKKSPRSMPMGISEVGDIKSSEDSSQQKESASKPKESLKRDEKASGLRPLAPQLHSQESVRDTKPSTSQTEEHHQGEDKSSKTQLPKSQYGRLFVKTLSKGTPVQQESAKEKRKNGGTIPWISHTTADIDALTEEDILSEDFTRSNCRLNRMLNVISSSGHTSSDATKDDMVDGNAVAISSLKQSDTDKETKLSAIPSETDKQGMTDTAKILPENNLVSATPSITVILPPRSISTTSEILLPNLEQVESVSSKMSTSTIPSVLDVFKAPSPTPSLFTAVNNKQSSDDTYMKTPGSSLQSVSSTSLPSPATSLALPMPQATPVSVPVTSQVTPSNLSSSVVQAQPITSLTESSKNFVAVTAAPSIFGAQKEEKQPVSSSPSILFGVSSVSNAQASSNSKPVFSLPASNVPTTSAVSSMLQPNITSPFSVTGTSTTTPSSAATTMKPASSSPASGAIIFGAAPVVTSSIEFPKTTSPVITFGGINTPTTSVTSSQAVAPSLISAKNTTSSSVDTSSKPTFSFSTLPTSSAPVPATTTGGFHFQFDPSTQSSVTAPKPPESGTSFKFTFEANKESTILSQPSAPSLTKPAAFAGSFNFGATSSANSQENKTMTFGTPGSINPTPAPASGGFSFSANNDPASNIQKPTFGLGATSSSTTPSNPLTSGGFNFCVKPSEPAAMAPSAPNVAAPFQFGTSSSASALSVQQQPAPVMGNPFSIGGTTEQKPMEEAFGSAQSTNMTTPLQTSPPTFDQPAIPSFNSQNVNTLQNPNQANSALFRFSSGTIGQPGMFSGSCSLGQTTATGVASTGFNFNPTGPSATTPFQFGASTSTPMFSIGSGSTAPRSRPRNRRQK